MNADHKRAAMRIVATGRRARSSYVMFPTGVAFDADAVSRRVDREGSR
jgi:hypothetical protein